MPEQRKNKGFSLVELIVSLTITAILMLGMSVFFSSTMHNMFSAQERLTNTQGQFVVNEIIGDKFANVEKFPVIDPNYVVLKNKITKGQMPLTFIGKRNNKLVFKDFFVFNDVETEDADIYYGDPYMGTISKYASGPKVTDLPYFAGFAKKTGMDTFYVAIPSSNEIKICNPTCNSSVSLGIPLNSPTDIEIDGDTLYISDSGNNRIIKYASGIAQVIATDLNFPTGLALDGSYLFVSDTFNNRIKRVLTSAPYTIQTVAGEGDDDTCNNTALYCKLDLPTGLHADSASKTLYIADTGKNRILKVGDPGSLNSKTAEKIAFDLQSATKISKINYTFNGVTLSGTLPANDLRPGHFEETDTDIDYQLLATISGIFCESTDIGIPPASNIVCQLKYVLVDHPEIFQGGDEIIINDTDSYTVDHVDGFDVYLNPNNTTHTYANGDSVKINTTFSIPKKITLTLNLSSSSPNPVTNRFANILIELFDQANVKIQTVNSILRIGDDVLGTPEDKIEEVYTTGLDFPTGIALAGGSVIVANSLDGNIRNMNTSSDLAPIIVFATIFPTFDYTSDFDITNLAFQKLNESPPGTYHILELNMDAVVDVQTDPVTTQTYIFDAKIKN